MGRGPWLRRQHAPHVRVHVKPHFRPGETSSQVQLQFPARRPTCGKSMSPLNFFEASTCWGEFFQTSFVRLGSADVKIMKMASVPTPEVKWTVFIKHRATDLLAPCTVNRDGGICLLYLSLHCALVMVNREARNHKSILWWI